MEDTKKRIKRHSTDLDKNLVKHTFDKVLVSKTYKDIQRKFDSQQKERK